jgi:hypothetical protein
MGLKKDYIVNFSVDGGVPGETAPIALYQKSWGNVDSKLTVARKFWTDGFKNTNDTKFSNFNKEIK